MRLRSRRTRGIGTCMLSLIIAVALAGCLTGTTPTLPLDQDPGDGVADTDFLRALNGIAGDFALKADRDLLSVALERDLK